MLNELKPLSKNEFCRAVTGKTMSQHFEDIDKGIDAKLLEANPNLSDTEHVVESHFTFMSTSTQVPLLDMPLAQLYLNFKGFRAWEEKAHPRDRCKSYGDYFGPTYAEIEAAYQKNDEQAFKRGIQELVDQILHD